MASHSSILACEIPWTQQPGGLQSMVEKVVKKESDTTQQLKNKCSGSEILLCFNIGAHGFSIVHSTYAVSHCSGLFICDTKQNIQVISVFSVLLPHLISMNVEHGSVPHTCVCSVMSNSLQPRGLQPTRPLCPWNFPGKNTGVGCHALLQGIFPTHGSKNFVSSALTGRFFTNCTTSGTWLYSSITRKNVASYRRYLCLQQI